MQNDAYLTCFNLIILPNTFKQTSPDPYAKGISKHIVLCAKMWSSGALSHIISRLAYCYYACPCCFRVSSSSFLLPRTIAPREVFTQKDAVPFRGSRCSIWLCSWILRSRPIFRVCCEYGTVQKILFGVFRGCSAITRLPHKAALRSSHFIVLHTAGSVSLSYPRRIRFSWNRAISSRASSRLELCVRMRRTSALIQPL
jgi:hypothetical protein